MPTVSTLIERSVRHEYLPKTGGLPTYVVKVPTAIVTQTFNDDIPQRWKSVIQPDGWRAPTPYVRRTQLSPVWQGGYQLVVHDTPTVLRRTIMEGAGDPGYVGNFELFSPWVDSNMLRRAEVEALTQLKQFKASYGVFLTEMRQSVDMLSKNLQQLALAGAAAKRRQWKKAARTLKVRPPNFKAASRDVSGRWLELQYGWAPLVDDIYSIYQDMTQRPQNPTLHVKRHIRRDVSSSTTKYVLGVRHEYRDQGSLGTKVRLDYVLNNAALLLASSLGLTNPAVIAWEKTRMSFLVDWAVPIGNYLSALDATFGLTFKGGTYSNFSRTSRVGRATCSQKPGLPSFDSFAFSGVHQQMLMGRNVYATSPIPLPYYKSPVSTDHAFNALALLRGAFS